MRGVLDGLAQRESPTAFEAHRLSGFLGLPLRVVDRVLPGSVAENILVLDIEADAPDLIGAMLNGRVEDHPKLAEIPNPGFDRIANLVALELRLVGLLARFGLGVSDPGLNSEAGGCKV